MNTYEKAMFEVCKVLENYSKDKQFAVYGFGGVPTYCDSKGNIYPHEQHELANPIKETKIKKQRPPSSKSSG